MVSATELRDAEVVASGTRALENASATIRLEDARLGRIGPTAFVPEPAAFWQLVAGLGLVALLARRRAGRLPLSVLAACALGVLSLPASGQVPQDTSFTGRLLHGPGNPVLEGQPLAGPVDLELRVFDAAIGGTQLYGEQHLNVPLDATGGFSVQLGLGTSPSGSYDADLFSDVNRWLEVVVDGEVLTTRPIVGAVPWALVAERANEVVRDPNAPRFEDCGDGTVADHRTGLQWEKKSGTVGSPVPCQIAACPDPHDVNNLYRWSIGGGEPDGEAFSDFLEKLNGLEGAFECFVHCDWRLPEIGELRTILIGPYAAPGQDGTCTVAPCIDPGFGAVGGVTNPSDYWSATRNAVNGSEAWIATFAAGFVYSAPNGGDAFVRAVRTGSCD